MSNDLDNYNNYGVEDSPSSLNKPEKINKGKENKNDDLLQVFGDNINTGNLDYLNSLLKNHRKSQMNK